jgi:histidine triad (HIT) family protein
MSDSCLFCRLVRREIPAAVVAETETAIAFRDVNPQAPLHVLVIPKRHVASLADVDADDAALVGELSLVAVRVAREAGYDASGFRTVVNTGADAGQTVHHLHLHVLAGRPLHWPPG